MSRDNRHQSRRRLRQAYDILSKRWREERRKHDSLSKLGLRDIVIGRKPPFSVFVKCIPEGEDPVQIALTTSPLDFYEYAHEFDLPRWRGDEPRRGVIEIPVLGDDDGGDET